MKRRELAAERDRILRAAGFEDIEDEWGNLAQVTRSHGPLGHDRARINEAETLTEYFRLAGHFLHDHAFADDVERRIWELHQDGATYTRINRTVRREMAEGSLTQRRMYRKLVFATVTSLRAQMLGLERPTRPRGRPREPGGCYRGCVVIRARVPDAVAAAFRRIAERTGRSASDVLRWMVTEIDKRMATS